MSDPIDLETSAGKHEHWIATGESDDLIATPIRPDVAALLIGTTPGPWEVDPRRPSDVQMAGAKPDSFVAWICTSQRSRECLADARLIAAAPALAAEVRALRSEVARLRAALAGLFGGDDEYQAHVVRCTSDPCRTCDVLRAALDNASDIARLALAEGGPDV